MARNWKKEEIEFLLANYPGKGRLWCAYKLNRSEGSIRQKTSDLGIKLNRIDGEHFISFQKRAAESKIGKKHSQSWRDSIAKGNTGKKKSKEHIESMKLGHKKAVIEGRYIHPRGMLNKKFPPESIEKMKQTNLKRYGELAKPRSKESCMKAVKTRIKRYGKSGFFSNNTYSRCKRGWLEVGGKEYFFRSLWEKNYACYLEWLKNKKEIKEWFFEEDTFWFDKIKRGIRSYMPDFKVFTNNGLIEYHEVKGWMDKKSKTKIKRMAKYYPEVKLIIIDQEQYKALKKWSKMIDGWQD